MTTYVRTYIHPSIQSASAPIVLQDPGLHLCTGTHADDFGFGSLSLPLQIAGRRRCCRQDPGAMTTWIRTVRGPRTSVDRGGEKEERKMEIF